MKLRFAVILLVCSFVFSEGKTLLEGNGNPKTPQMKLRPRLVCQELCRVQCEKAWTDFKACFDISWGCNIGCAEACHEDSTITKCREKCTESFDQRCSALGCNRGCALGSSYEIRFDDIEESTSPVKDTDSNIEFREKET